MSFCHTGQVRGKTCPFLVADIAQQLAQVAQIQAALKESQDQVVQQKAIATQAEAAMKMAQAEAAAAAENVKLEKETGDQCTEEAMRAMTAVDVQLQQAKVRPTFLVPACCVIMCLAVLVDYMHRNSLQHASYSYQYFDSKEV